MAQAWHRPRRQLAADQGAEARCWRASEYVLVDELMEEPVAVEAAPKATWERFTPFDSYQPTSRAREVEAGPHLMFLRLKSILRECPERGEKALILFANRYGLLGGFEEYHLQPFLSSVGRRHVAPEVVIDNRGRLQQVDPATEGKDLLLELLASKGQKVHRFEIAVPSEISDLLPLRRLRRDVPWEIKEDIDALLVLDEEAPLGVSVLSIREPLLYWHLMLRSFPSGDTPVEDLMSDKHTSLNSHLQYVSPYVFVGEDGELERGWRCDSLLQAMYVMFSLDRTGGNNIKKCQRSGCPNHFRVGAQKGSKYCSEKCANHASTRRGRGQEP